MTERDLFREIGMIDEKYVVEAQETKYSIIHNVVFRRSLVSAACLLVCVGLYFSTRGIKNSETASNTENESYYTPVGSVVQSEKADEEKDYWSEEEIKAENALPDVELSEEQASSSVGEEGIGDTRNDIESVIAETQLREIEKKLASYPNELERICQTDAFVVLNEKAESGKEKWEEFQHSIKEGKEASIEIIKFTDEGDAIITHVYYNGLCYYVVEDSTRDTFGNGEICQKKFLYMHLLERDGLTEVILSDEEIMDTELLSSMDTSIHYLVHYWND